ncbi:hypothetical protein STSP2_01142 [Anaerohalosphaera lusitana]|uniref:Uncharacterized protein n=1 Tax=Anaerohalosphaera lusitana TaxID=1936003 RepID=A0A1U9NJS1_9BACT|nr:hypothetical protein [Anaerohalosphaera lusitana]AQT67988.1 hypothetical protein STSP2_01142 [Anaerohalosphaera lusitana]
MAIRPLFIPWPKEKTVITENLQFKWHPGFAVTQKQKSIKSLHDQATSQGYADVLEVSRKSKNKLGRDLSAFNLKIKIGSTDRFITVEAAFQGSKVFESGGPYRDIFGVEGNKAKRDPRLRDSGKLIKFSFNDKDWPLEPKTLFYDWLYLQALKQNPDLSYQLLKFDAFTDIEFNPKKSFNCQARSCALFKSLWVCGNLNECLKDINHYTALMCRHQAPQQKKLFADE